VKGGFGPSPGAGVKNSGEWPKGEGDGNWPAGFIGRGSKIERPFGNRRI